jgi:hypothetical protein
LIARADALADVARAGTVEEFARRLDLERKRLQDDDGMDRLARQRRNVRARSWVDAEGMWNLSAKFDPVTGVRVAARIDAMVQAMFGEAVPDECPSDPIEKQRYLAAHAVARLLLDEALDDGHVNTDDQPARTRPPRPRPAKPEFVAVIDADAPGHDGPVAEFSIGVEIPARVLATLAGNADTPRRRRAQRHRAVRTRRTEPGTHHPPRQPRPAPSVARPLQVCAIPGCSVAYDRCKLHHIIWWRHEGRTDLDNLLPVCSVHHANIHHDDWVIELGPNRELTLRLPDGTIHTTGPPNRRTAA